MMARRRVLLATAAVLGAWPVTASAVGFEKTEMDVGATPVEVLAGRFTDADGDLVVFTAGTRGWSRAVVSRKGGAWHMVHEGRVAPETVFVDKARVAGVERVLSFRSDKDSDRGDSVYWLDPADWTEKPLGVGALSTVYRGQVTRPVVLDFASDLNGDGADDVLLADFDGLWVSLQSADGSFAKPAKLPIVPSMVARPEYRPSLPSMFDYNGNVTYMHSRHRVFDYDGDGRADLMFGFGTRFRVLRNEGAGFGAPQGWITTPGMHGTAAGSPRMHGVGDYNGDGVFDIVVARMHTGGAPGSTAEFYFGRRGEQATVFGDAPDATVGRHSAFELADVDGDGRADVMATSMEFSVRRMASAIASSGSMPVDLAFYRMGASGFDDEPNATRSVKVRMVPGGGEPPKLPQLADVNGDGRKDLVHLDVNRMEIYLGVAGDDLFAKRAVKVGPARLYGGRDFEGLEVLDLDGDGRDDFLLRYPYMSGVNGVGVLLSRGADPE